MTYYRTLLYDAESASTGVMDGTNGFWSKDDSRDWPTIVTSAADGIITPYNGTKMMRFNVQNGGSGTGSFDTVVKDISSYYTSEVFVRIRFAFDANCEFNPGGGSGIHMNRFFEFSGAPNYWDNLVTNYTTGGWNCGIWVLNVQRGSTYFRGDFTKSAWHTWEFWSNSSTGEMKVWFDGTNPSELNITGVTDLSGYKWKKFYPMSNYSASALDSTNYIYFDKFEVFGDAALGDATATTGLMSDATIEASGGGSTSVKMGGWRSH